MDSTEYRSEATVMLATDCSGAGSSAASRIVTPADQASSTCSRRQVKADAEISHIGALLVE